MLNSRMNPFNRASRPSFSGQDRMLGLLLVMAVIWIVGIALMLVTARPSKPKHLDDYLGVGSQKDRLTSLRNALLDQRGTIKIIVPPVPPYSPPKPQSSPWSVLPNAAVLVLTYNRPRYLRQTLDAILRAEGIEYMKLYVSQDGSNPDISWTRTEYAEYNFTLWNRNRKPLLEANQGGTAYLAQHYKWAFDRLLFELNHSHVLIIEDDMLVSPDFFVLMRDGAALMLEDPSVWCISSWHDNGRKGLVYDPYRLFRTQYFPGLGWMMPQHVWRELSDKFPLDQWDHWMRLDTTHKGRSCIVPEIARNKNIGEEGTNMGGGFFERFLAPIQWQQLPAVKSFVKSGQSTLTHLMLDQYDQSVQTQLAKSEVLGMITDAGVAQKLEALRDSWNPITMTNRRSVVGYKLEDYRFIVSIFNFLPVPRSNYEGISATRIAASPRAVDASMLDDAVDSADDASHWIYFIDVRRVNYTRFLPSWLAADSSHSRLVWQPHPQLRMERSNEGESCTQACQRSGLVCGSDYFALANKCSALKQFFPCERDCQGAVQGADVPNYVSSPNKPDMLGKCLTQEETPQCGASHWSARRLCPCIPAS